jgi:hypothetical protein
VTDEHDSHRRTSRRVRCSKRGWRRVHAAFLGYCRDAFVLSYGIVGGHPFDVRMTGTREPKATVVLDGRYGSCTSMGRAPEG